MHTIRFRLDIDTISYKASQYDHVSDTCEKVPLSQKSKTIGGQEVQRDLYSAFLIRNCNAASDHPDRDRCVQEFDRFLRMQDHLIETMNQGRVSMCGENQSKK